MYSRYIIWVLGVIIWNYSFPHVSPMFDVIVALVLRHMFDIVDYLNIKSV